MQRDQVVDPNLCIEVITPLDTYVLTVPNTNRRTQSEVFLDLSALEISITQFLCSAHMKHSEKFDQDSYFQIILGTLHSHVITGNNVELKKALEVIKGKGNNIVDLYDEDGKTALHYACSKRSVEAVKLLVSSSADVNLPTKFGSQTPCHLSAERLDYSSLSLLLSSKLKNVDSNALDDEGFTPMFAACVTGRSVGASRDPFSLGKCLLILKSWGGSFVPHEMEHTVHPLVTVAMQWRAPEVSVILSNCDLKLEGFGGSLASRFGYPLHSLILSMIDRLQQGINIEEYDKMLNHSLLNTGKSFTSSDHNEDDNNFPLTR